METKAFFEKKVNLTPKDLNRVKSSSIEDIILEKAKSSIENKCSEQGFVLPGSVTLISRSMGYFEPARFTGDAIYYAKLQGSVIYPADGIKVIGQVIRKNKMGLYVNYKDAIRIQVPRDLHLGNEDYEQVEIGDMIEIEMKRSKFQINDDFILASGLFISNQSDKLNNNVEETTEQETTEQETTEEENTVLNNEFEEEKDQMLTEQDNTNPQMGGNYIDMDKTDDTDTDTDNVDTYTDNNTDDDN